MVQPQMYAQMPIPQMAQVPVQMAVPSAQVQMQNNSMTDQTAAMGHMREVMMQIKDVTADDNPCYMHMSEIPREGEASLKLLEGDDRGTITLPTQGYMPIKVPNYNSFCITHFEAEKVYKCVESDQIVSPLVFP